MLTDQGTVYRSRDRGGSWKRLQQAMSQVGGQVADQDQEVSSIAIHRLHFLLMISFLIIFVVNPSIWYTSFK